MVPGEIKRKEVGAGPSNVVSKRQLRLVLKLILDVKVSQVTTPLERVPVVPGKLRRYPIEIEAACSGCSDLGIVCPTPLALSRRRFQSNLIFQLSTPTACESILSRPVPRPREVQSLLQFRIVQYLV